MLLKRARRNPVRIPTSGSRIEPSSEPVLSINVDLPSRTIESFTITLVVRFETNDQPQINQYATLDESEESSQ